MTRWDVAALLGGGAGAGLWYGWSKMVVPDKITPILIMLLPVVFVVFRKPIDRILTPLQKVKRHIPRLVLVGLGLALPYLVANYLYKHGVSNYPLARKSIIWGTILGYVVMRIPQPGLPTGGALGKFQSLARASCWLPLWWMLFGVVQLLLVDTALADHFKQTGYKDLEDGLRTGGWAQAIAGTAGTVINALVNGGLVFPRTPTNLRPPEGGEPGGGGDGGGPGGGGDGGDKGSEGKKEEPTRYTMDIKTEQGRKSLAADGKDRLWMYAQITCRKRGAVMSELTAPLTNAIQFQFEGTYAGWMSIKSTQFPGGYKGVLLAAEPPRPNAEVEENAKVTVVVSGATAEGDPIEVPVELSLEAEPKMKVTVIS